MVHGSPRVETCTSCNTYGLTPRFSESKCPDCGGKTEGIEINELKRKLGILIHEDFWPGFGWSKIINKED